MYGNKFQKVSSFSSTVCNRTKSLTLSRYSFRKDVSLLDLDIWEACPMLKNLSKLLSNFDRNLLFTRLGCICLNSMRWFALMRNLHVCTLHARVLRAYISQQRLWILLPYKTDTKCHSSEAKCVIRKCLNNQPPT